MSDIAFNVKFQESKLCRAAYYYLHRIHSIRDNMLHNMLLNFWLTPSLYLDLNMETASSTAYRTSY